MKFILSCGQFNITEEQKYDYEQMNESEVEFGIREKSNLAKCANPGNVASFPEIS